MRPILLLLAIQFFIFGCKTENKLEQSALADLNLYLESEVKVDSVFVSNISQDREFQFIPYSDNLHIEFNDSINDLYNLTFYAGEKKMMKQLWLNGEHLVVKGKITNGLKIDTIIGSSLYYNSMDFRKRYSQLLENETDSAAINNFLLDELKENIDNPYSIEIANNFFRRNLSNKEELKKIYTLQSSQKDEIKNHMISSYDKIENILTVDKVDLTHFKFYDANNQLVSIDLEEDKKYLLDFWFMACAPCIKEHKIMVDKKDMLEKHNVQLIGISTDRDQSKWSEYVKDKNYFWHNIREQDEYHIRLTTDMLISAFPTHILLDGTGNILYRANSFSAVEEYLSNG